MTADQRDSAMLNLPPANRSSMLWRVSDQQLCMQTCHYFFLLLFPSLSLARSCLFVCLFVCLCLLIGGWWWWLVVVVLSAANGVDFVQRKIRVDVAEQRDRSEWFCLLVCLFASALSFFFCLLSSASCLLYFRRGAQTHTHTHTHTHTYTTNQPTNQPTCACRAMCGRTGHGR